MTHRFFITALILACLSASVSACNTVEGVGQDLKSAGQTIENTARR
jgi:predicted small secreted protein